MISFATRDERILANNNSAERQQKMNYRRNWSRMPAKHTHTPDGFRQTRRIATQNKDRIYLHLNVYALNRKTARASRWSNGLQIFTRTRTQTPPELEDRWRERVCLWEIQRQLKREGRRAGMQCLECEDRAKEKKRSAQRQRVELLVQICFCRSSTNALCHILASAGVIQYLNILNVGYDKIVQFQEA